VSDGPLVSVIAIFDRGEFEPCLRSLLDQEGVDFEVLAVVGDEASARGLPEDDRVRAVVIEDRNPALRRNRAAKEARGAYLAFIDDDATAPEGWLERGVSYLEDNLDVAGVGGPNLCPKDAGFWERVTDTILCTPVIGAGSRAYSGGGELAEARPGEIHLVNFIVRKEWFDRIDGFNEGLGYGGEDTEFIYQGGKLGARFIFDPELIVYHRRRPFGLSYFRQRFHLRRQSARLFVAYLGIYGSNSSFGAALVAPLLAITLFFLIPSPWRFLFIGVILILYILGAAFLSHRVWKGARIFTLLFPLAFFLHHTVYILGLWFGIAEVFITFGRTSLRIQRDIGPHGG